MKTTYIPGKWLAICDVCGLRFYNTELKKDWRNLYVCSRDFETRHSQDFVKGVPDNPAVDWVRPESIDVFTRDACTLYGLSAIPGFASPGCALPGRLYNGDFYRPTTAISGYAVSGYAITGTST